MNAESTAALKSVSTTKDAMRWRILAHCLIQGVHGVTCDEIEEALGFRHQTASARLKELKDMKALVDSGRRRPTRSGRRAAVLIPVSPEVPSWKTCQDVVESGA